MTDEKNPRQPKKAAPKAAPRAVQDDDVAGKAYDGRLMRRLLTYLRPYKLQVAISSVATILKSATDSAGPLLVMIAVDTYMVAKPPEHLPWLARHLSRYPIAPMRGITLIAAIYLGALLFTFLLELLQTYLMQWTGQKVMFDMRRQIFRHLQRMSPAFFDRNPVGRLVTRLTSDVDALNEMFTSGVLAIFEDVFTLAFIVGIMVWKSWPLALLTLAVIPAILFVTRIFRAKVRDSYRRQRAATAKINSFTQEYVSGMSIVQLFNRERRAFNDFSAVNAENKQAWTDAIFAYAWYYPVVEFLSSTAIALILWRGGTAVLHNTAFLAAHPSLNRASGFFGTVSIGVLIGFIQYAQRFFRPIMDLSEKYNILQAAMAASERVFKLIDTEPLIVSPAHPIAGNATGSIEFRNVWFTYQQLTEEQRSHLDAVILSEAQNLRSLSSPANFSGASLSGASRGLQPPESVAPQNGASLSGASRVAGLGLWPSAQAPQNGASFSGASRVAGLGLWPGAQAPQNGASLSGASRVAGLGLWPSAQAPQNGASFSGGSRGLQAPESASPTPGGFSPGPSANPSIDPSLADIEWILRGVSFTVDPGETAAIVGHTGAGKTTIISLMMRFYDIQQGQILIDGVDIRDQDLTALRRRFGVVLQDPFLFTGTIADNIRLGSKWITDEALEEAAEEVNIADFIHTLPLKFQEPVQERGATLSTGQKQLISFARALAHEPAILVLDEATSSVDTDTEYRVRLALSRMITGRTSVLIAHRLSTVQSADTILVMHKGQLRERGNHQQLLTQRGLYYKLYQLQYRDQELVAPHASAPVSA